MKEKDSLNRWDIWERERSNGCGEQRQGRLNQWVHWARAQGPLIFLRGLQLAVVKYFLKLIILLLMLLHDRTNTSSAYLVNLT